MPAPDTLLAALVRGVRAHGHRPAGAPSGALTWSEVAQRARLLGLGLEEAGWAQRPVAVAGSGDPVQDLGHELAVLGAGAVLALPGARSEAQVRGEALRGPDGSATPLDALVARGVELDRADPSAAERHLAALDPASAAVVDGRRTTSHGEARWALRAVDRWLAPALAPGPRIVVAGPDAGPALPVALVGRWWPASTGAALAAPPATAAGLGTIGADLALLDAATWAELATLLRHRAARSLGGASLLRRGRLVVSGESASRRDRLAHRAAGAWAGERVRSGAGLTVLRVGLALEPLDVGTGRDLAAAGAAPTAAWAVDGVAAPLAAGPLDRAGPGGGWGRPLPGRTLRVDGATTLVCGGDVPGSGIVVDGGPAVDLRGRVALPRRPSGVAPPEAAG